MAYVYRGNLRDVSDGTAGKPGPKPGLRVFDASKCGTYPGYQQHKRHNQDACDPCAEANAEYMRAWRAVNRPSTPRPVGVYDPEFCGEDKGYHRHRRQGTTPCKECRAGHAATVASYKAVRSGQVAA